MRYYVKLLFKQRLIIVLAVTIAVFTTIVLILTGTEAYEAEATVAMLRTRTEVEFDSRISTLSDYELASIGISDRRDALLALVTSNQVVQSVLETNADSLRADERDIDVLREMVEVQATGDLININIRHENPEVAAVIANSWAQQYEHYVNNLYSGRPRGASSITEQVESARQRYQETQGALEAFTVEEQILRIQREIAIRESQLQSYRRMLMRIQVSPTETSQDLLNDYYRELQDIENWLAVATSLRDQVSQGSDSTAAEFGNAVALLMLRTKIFGGVSSSTTTTNAAAEGEVTNEMVTSTMTSSRGGELGPSLVLQLDLSNAQSVQVTAADVDAVIEVLDRRHEDTLSRIDTLVREVNDGGVIVEPSSTESQIMAEVSSLEGEISVLQSQLEAQSAHRRELEASRDSAWDTYQALLAKRTEEDIVTGSPAAEVSIADSAVVPTRPVSRGLIVSTVLVASVALIVAIGCVLLLDWWRRGDSPILQSATNEDVSVSRAPELRGQGNVASQVHAQPGQMSDSVT